MSPPSHGIIPTTDPAFIERHLPFIGPCHLQNFGGKTKSNHYGDSNEPPKYNTLHNLNPSRITNYLKIA